MERKSLFEQILKSRSLSARKKTRNYNGFFIQGERVSISRQVKPKLQIKTDMVQYFIIEPSVCLTKQPIQTKIYNIQFIRRPIRSSQTLDMPRHDFRSLK